MIIRVHTLSGRKHQVSVDPRQLVASIKEQVYRIEGVPVEQQILLFRGVGLADNSIVSEVGLHEGDIVHMTIALRSG